MIHVVDFEKTAFSTPFRGVLAPSGPQISAESGRATHSLAPGKPGWPQRPSGHCSPAPRPTPHAPRQNQRGQAVRRPLPAGYCLLPTARLPKFERGPISPTSRPLSVCHRTDDSFGKINPFLSTADSGQSDGPGFQLGRRFPGAGRVRRTRGRGTRCLSSAITSICPIPMTVPLPRCSHRAVASSGVSGPGPSGSVRLPATPCNSISACCDPE